MSKRPAAQAAAPQWSLPRGLIVLVSVAGLVVSVAGIRSVAGIVGPVFLALMLTIAVHPAGRWLRGKGCPRWLAFLTVLTSVYAILIALFGSIIFSIARLATILPEYSDKFDDLVNGFHNFLVDHGVSSEDVHKMLSSIDSSKIIGAVGDILGSVASATSALILVIVVALFMAIDAIGVSERMNILARSRPDVAAAFNNFAAGTRSYLIVTTVFGFIVAVLDSGALWALGIPLPILWGLLSFITNYIPNIGFIIGVIPPALLGLLDGGASKMILVIVIYSAINVILQSVIQPKFVGDAVGLSTTLTFLSLIIWSWIIGPLGAILAVPLTLFAKGLLIDIDPATRWADILLADSVKTAEQIDDEDKNTVTLKIEND
ncbi:AI-2E family transporter [Gordonia sp. CPCC 205333]|uniref:AI-2E family transporter n=1 Tax=Gordonia sp. CPCC 205333 TaxID=3140790 RepID=UPI003AF3C4CC